MPNPTSHSHSIRTGNRVTLVPREVVRWPWAMGAIMGWTQVEMKAQPQQLQRSQLRLQRLQIGRQHSR